MELTDALLTAGPVLSPAHLSREAVHRRGWGSLSAALAEGRITNTALRHLLIQHPLIGGVSPNPRKFRHAKSSLVTMACSLQCAGNLANIPYFSQ